MRYVGQEALVLMWCSLLIEAGKHESFDVGKGKGPYVGLGELTGRGRAFGMSSKVVREIMCLSRGEWCVRI